MFFLALIWSLFGALAIAIGVESRKTLQSVLKFGLVMSGIHRLLLVIGLLISLGVVGFSFYDFVTGNAIIVLCVWLAVFLVARLAIEIMKRKNIYGEMPAGESGKDKESRFIRRPEESQSSQALESALPDVDDDAVEEIESNFQRKTVKEPREFADEINTSTEDAEAEPISRPQPDAMIQEKREPAKTAEEIIGDDPRSAEFNEIFNRLNK